MVWWLKNILSSHCLTLFWRRGGFLSQKILQHLYSSWGNVWYSWENGFFFLSPSAGWKFPLPYPSPQRCRASQTIVKYCENECNIQENLLSHLPINRGVGYKCMNKREQSILRQNCLRQSFPVLDGSKNDWAPWWQKSRMHQAHIVNHNDDLSQTYMLHQKCNFPGIHVLREKRRWIGFLPPACVHDSLKNSQVPRNSDSSIVFVLFFWRLGGSPYANRFTALLWLTSLGKKEKK